MKRRVLLVDDEIAVLLTLKAVLEISGFDVDTAASAREAKSKLRNREYHMVITDMRMENEAAGAEVVAAARAASYHPAVALLTAFPMADEDWQTMGADKMLVKPMHTRILLQQIEKLLSSHEAKLKIWSTPPPPRQTADAAMKPNGTSGNGATKTKRTTSPTAQASKRKSKVQAIPKKSAPRETSSRRSA